jgi:hypothetical protein
MKSMNKDGYNEKDASFFTSIGHVSTTLEQQQASREAEAEAAAAKSTNVKTGLMHSKKHPVTLQDRRTAGSSEAIAAGVAAGEAAAGGGDGAGQQEQALATASRLATAPAGTSLTAA